MYPGTSSDHEVYYADTRKFEKMRTSEITHDVPNDLMQERPRDGSEVGSRPGGMQGQSTMPTNFLDRPLGPRMKEEDRRDGTGEPSVVGGTPSGSNNLDMVQDMSGSNISRRAEGDILKDVVVAPPLPTSPFDMPFNQEVVIGSSSNL